MSNLVGVIKQAAVEAVNASDPTGVIYGTVTSVGPLSIMVDQKLTLTTEFLVLTNSVKDYRVKISYDFESQETDGHTHRCQGATTVTVYNALKVGDKVILLRQQGGQKYLVLDRRDANAT